MKNVEELKEYIVSNKDDTPFLLEFLNKSTVINNILINGTDNEITCLFNILNNIPIEHFIALLNQIVETDTKFSASDVPCFSTMLNGMVRLPELLEFYPEGLTFHDIGYQMKKPKTSFACIKYGENHTKLAAKMSLVTIPRSKPAQIKLTAIGKFLIPYSLKEKKNVLRALLLQDPFMQYLIYQIVYGDKQYVEVVSSLSPSTAFRRKTSVKQLAEFILTSTKFESKFINYDWKV